MAWMIASVPFWLSALWCMRGAIRCFTMQEAVSGGPAFIYCLTLAGAFAAIGAWMVA